MVHADKSDTDSTTSNLGGYECRYIIAIQFKVFLSGFARTITIAPPLRWRRALLENVSSVVKNSRPVSFPSSAFIDVTGSQR